MDSPRGVSPGDGLMLGRGAIFLVTAAPLVVAPGVLFPYVVGKATWMRLFTEVALALWLALSLRRGAHAGLAPRRGPPGGSWVLLAFAAWLGVSAAAGLAGVSPGRSLWSTYERMQGWVGLAHAFALAAVAASVFRDSRDWRRLFVCSLAVGTLVCGWGLATHYGVPGLPGARDMRLTAGFGNPTYLGAYLAVNALLGAGLSVRRRSRNAPSAGAWRYAFALCVALHVWALWLTASRGALLALVVGGAALCVALAFRCRPGRRTLGAAVLLAGLGAALWVNHVGAPAEAPQSMTARLAATGVADDASGRRRLAAATAGLRGFTERPLLGWGPENFVVVWGRFAPPGVGMGEHFDHAHNQLVEELATKGLFGFAAYVLLWVALARALWRAIRHGDTERRVLAAAAGAGLAAFFVQHLFLLDTPASGMQFALLAGFAAWTESPARSRAVAGDHTAHTVRGVLRRGRPVIWFALAAVAASTLYAVVYRPLVAARMASDAFAAQPPTVTSIAETVRAIDAFPPLGNDLRLRLFARTDLAALPEADFPRALEILQTQGGAAARTEPWNWRVPGTLALAHGTGISRDSALRTLVGEHLADLRALAPGLAPAAGAISD